MYQFVWSSCIICQVIMHHVPGHHAMCRVIAPCARSSGHHASRACTIMRHVPAPSCAMCLHHYAPFRISPQDMNMLPSRVELHHWFYHHSLWITTTISNYLFLTDFAPQTSPHFWYCSQVQRSESSHFQVFCHMAFCRTILKCSLSKVLRHMITAQSWSVLQVLLLEPCSTTNKSTATPGGLGCLVNICAIRHDTLSLIH